MIQSLNRRLGFIFDPVCSRAKIEEKVAMYRALYAERFDGMQPE